MPSRCRSRGAPPASCRSRSRSPGAPPSSRARWRSSCCRWRSRRESRSSCCGPATSATGSTRGGRQQRRGMLAALAAALFVAPVAVHGFADWTRATEDDPNRLTPGLTSVLRELPDRQVVFSDLETSYRIAAAAPVLLAAGPPAHVADTEANRPYERRQDVLAFLRSGDLAIPRKYGAAWLVIDRKRHAVRVPLSPAYANARYSLFRL